MSRYPNGQIPARLLVEVGPYHWLTAPTAARWHALVADILKHEGVTMRITPGKNGYRDKPGQVFARNNACARGRCNDAAIPGTSSHGGECRGRDSMAIDVQNWGVLGKDKWYAYCRKHGFDPGFFDWEPWHIIDWNPWVLPATTGSSATPIPVPEPEEEEDDMPKNTGLLYRAPMEEPKEKQREYLLILNTGSGYHGTISSGLGGEIEPDRRREFANAFDTTSIIRVNEAEAKAFKAELPSIRPSV